MNECDYCGTQAYLGFTCWRCDGFFCKDHRLPEAHDCPYKNMRKDAIPFIKQYPPVGQQGTATKRESYSKEDGKRTVSSQEKISRPEFNDKESMTPAPGKAITLHLGTSMFMFLVFIVLDVIALMYSGPIAFIPLGVHVAFLPRLISNMKGGGLSTGPVLEGVKSLFRTYLIYVSIYFITKIVVSFLVLDFITAVVFILIGARMTFTFWQMRVVMRMLDEQPGD